LSATVRANRERILAAVELRLSNFKLEGLNSKIRLINHRGYGPSLRGRRHRHDLPLLRRHHHRAALQLSRGDTGVLTHTNLRRTSYLTIPP
jgi:hypothetical protein